MDQKFNLKAKDHLHSGESKKRFNREHFSEAAHQYDRATRCLSLGRDHSWKRRLVSEIETVTAPVCVDMACGTGDVAFLIAERFPEARILGIDLTEEMIEFAEKRNSHGNVTFSCSDMCSLDIADGSVDVITGSYAIRNAPELDVAIQEFCRILKPGGTMYFLDFSKPESKIAQRFQYITLKLWGSFWGIVFHGNPQVHGYISESLRKFPSNAALEETFQNHDLEVKKSEKLFGGMMRLHILEG